MGLILAQGAEHMKPHQLKAVVAKIQTQFSAPYNHDVGMAKLKPELDRIAEKYNGGMPLNISIETVNGRAMFPMPYEYVVEEKYDGYSYLNDGGKFFSKRLSEAKGNEGQPIEKTGHLPHLTQVLRPAYENGGLDLHGEVYIPGGISDDVTKILGCDEDKAVKRINDGWDKRPRFMLIDIRKFHNIICTNEPYWVRRILLEHAFRTYIRPYNINNDVRLAELLWNDPVWEFRRIVNGGGEGIIIKKTSATYCPDKKPADNWIKGKKKVTVDVVIMGFRDGTGKNKDMFGSIEFGLYIDGTLKKCGACSSGLNDNTRQLIARDPDSYIGQVMEIEAIQESVKSFRNAVFLRLRDDKSASECTPMTIHVIDTLV